MDMTEHVDIPEYELMKFGQKVLKDELKKRGSAIYGTKDNCVSD